MLKFTSSFHKDHESGGAALEYIIVSVFGLILSVGAITLVGQAAQDKLQDIETKLGIDLNTDVLNLFKP